MYHDDKICRYPMHYTVQPRLTVVFCRMAPLHNGTWGRTGEDLVRLGGVVEKAAHVITLTRGCLDGKTGAVPRVPS